MYVVVLQAHPGAKRGLNRVGVGPGMSQAAFSQVEERKP